MKKKVITILIIAAILVGIGCHLYGKDNIRFKYSYEIINNEVLGNNKKIKVKIPFDNKIKYMNNEELEEFLENGTGLVYFGYSTCPWCRNAVPVLIESARNNDITINYIDIKSVKLSDTVYEILNDYLREDENGNKVLAVPDVYVLEEGEILDHHLGCIDGYTNPYVEMTESEKIQLQEIYDEMIKELKG